ncbi:hypothetical protein [Pedobacter sp. BMA]|uniref:hypothetical protein n=1 Tax=Pedobacter sp. BMA TaxID=1663685 RepID=UPI00064A48C9|nr:hypothetical protein [Pedobacter sp. BMA]KLT66478.1 hypothetical protein AB669_04620 [Pedobacter sp. BMA]
MEHLKIHKTVFQFRSKLMQSLAPSLIQYLNEVEALEKENERLKKSGDVVTILNKLQADLQPVVQFHTSPHPNLPKQKKLSKKQQEQAKLDAHIQMLDRLAFEEIKKGT